MDGEMMYKVSGFWAMIQHKLETWEILTLLSLISFGLYFGSLWLFLGCVFMFIFCVFDNM